MAEFSRNKGGERLDFHGVDLLHAPDVMPPGRFPMAINIRAYRKLAIIGRNLLTNALYSLASAVHSLKRLNDSSPNAPASGYSIINGASTVLSAWNSTIGVKNVATGLSGNPVSMVPFRPNTSVQAVMYVADSAAQGSTTLHTQYLGANASGPSGTPVDFVSNGMMKVSCNDGYTGTPTPTAVCWKMGLAEPQLAPIVSTVNTDSGTNGIISAKAIPWTNYNTANSSYNYGETNGLPSATPDGTGPYIINCANASFITINSITYPSGEPTINGATHAPSDSSASWVSSSYPAYYIQQIGTGSTPPSAASVVVGAFTFGDDAFTTGGSTLIAKGVAPLYIPSVVDVGAVIGVTNGITIPYGAQTFQIGINSSGNSFHSNSGSYSISVTVTTNALPQVTATIGTLTASYFDNSPTTGPVVQYIWKNAGDSGGSGPVQSVSDAVGTTTGNSFIFDACFGTTASPSLPPGIPGPPGIDLETVGSNVTANPMLWTELTPESVVSGQNAVFSAVMTKTRPTNTQFANFNFCLTGNIYFPSGGPGVYYTLVLTYKDAVMWGIGGGVTLVPGSATGVQYVYTTTAPASLSATNSMPVTLSDAGQTITVASGIPLLPRVKSPHGDGGLIYSVTLQVNPPAAGIYPIEIDYDYWYHSGRMLLLEASATAGGSPTIIPPLTGGSGGPSIRQNVQYRYVYRSSATGAISNPSPESASQSIPVMANTISSFWSPDPQVDVVDYYRIDSVLLVVLLTLTQAQTTILAVGEQTRRLRTLFPTLRLEINSSNTTITNPSLLSTFHKKALATFQVE